MEGDACGKASSLLSCGSEMGRWVRIPHLPPVNAVKDLMVVWQSLAYCTGLENQQRRNPFVSSNLTATASLSCLIVIIYVGIKHYLLK
jgi:hypothetical protein